MAKAGIGTHDTTTPLTWDPIARARVLHRVAPRCGYANDVAVVVRHSHQRALHKVDPGLAVHAYVVLHQAQVCLAILVQQRPVAENGRAACRSDAEQRRQR